MLRGTKLAVPFLALVLAACGGGGGDSVKTVSLTTFEDAAVVLDKADLGSGSVSLFSEPYGDAGWDGSRLYLPDYGFSQIQVFDGVPTAAGTAPAFTITQVTDGTDTIDLYGPQTVLFAGGKAVIVEYSANRILILDGVPTADAPIGTVSAIVGGTGLKATLSGCTASTLSSQESAYVVGNKLIVADSDHNRVLIWNELPTTSGKDADLVLGQADLTSCDVNRGSASPDATTLRDVSDVWSDGTRLFVADSGNNRVLGWNRFPTANGQAADFVLGQADFTTSGSATSQAGFNYPYFLDSNGVQLFVADASNNRVLVWSALPSATGALPDIVLGQADFDHGACDDLDQDGTKDTGPAASTLCYPAGVQAVGDALVVTDEGNARYLIFR